MCSPGGSEEGGEGKKNGVQVAWDKKPEESGIGDPWVGALLMWGRLLVLKDKEVVSQGLVDLDCLLPCGTGVSNITRGLTLSHMPVPHKYMTCHAQFIFYSSSAQAS